MPVAEAIQQDVVKRCAVFQEILVATDFSKASRRALTEAVALASENDAHLSVVHVLLADWRYEMLENPPELDLERQDAEQKLAELIQSVPCERKIETTLLKQSSIAEAVAIEARDRAADLLVVGTRGLGGIAKMALGSVAEELLRIAPCPVMTMGPHADVSPESGFKSILFATDFGKGSAKALPLALGLAKLHGAKLILLHMISPMPVTSANVSGYAPAPAAADEVQGWVDASRKHCLQQLRECLPVDLKLVQPPEFVAGTDFLPEGIFAAVEKFHVDLIVMGANHAGSAKVAAHIPWSAVHEVARNARCPVLTVAG